jgi:hypothetical protein
MSPIPLTDFPEFQVLQAVIGGNLAKAEKILDQTRPADLRAFEQQVAMLAKLIKERRQ